MANVYRKTFTKTPPAGWNDRTVPKPVGGEARRITTLLRHRLARSAWPAARPVVVGTMNRLFDAGLLRPGRRRTCQTSIVTGNLAVSEDHVTRLRKALDTLHRYQTRPQEPDDTSNPLDEAKCVFESIPCDLQATVLPKAIGKGIRRFQAAALMLGACPPSDCVDSWILQQLRHADSERRDWMIQIVGNQELRRFADTICDIVDSDDDSRWWAVSAAGDLGTDDCLECLIRLADSFGDQPIPMALIQALAKYESTASSAHLMRVLDSTQPDHERVFAAWGLAKQGKDFAFEFLVSKLDDCEGEYPTLPGRRAAQALSDLFDWQLEWTPEAPRLAKQRWLSLNAKPKTPESG